MTSWASSFVGITWRDRGRDRDGCDCWGLARLVYAEILEIDLPSYDEGYASTAEQEEIDRLISQRRADGPWVDVLVPASFDLVLFRHGRHDTHVGIVVDGRHMLHMVECGQARIERFDTPLWSRRIRCFARHASRFEEPSKALAERPEASPIADDRPGGRALYMPAPDPRVARIDVTFPEGATIAQIVAMVTPSLPPELAKRTRVVLVTPKGTSVIEPELWHLVRPKAGVRVVIRTVPAGGNFWRQLLMIVVAVAAIALGQLWGASLALGLGISTAAATALITIGVTAIGMLLINALIPVKKKSDDDKEYGGYSLQGWKNSSNPDGPIPVPFGRMRMAPYYAAAPYTEIVGDIQYVRAVFVWGYGPGALSDFKFGDTPITDYDDVEIEHRYGWADDAQLTLYTQQVIEEGLPLVLTRAWERNDDGSYKDGGTTIEKPEKRYTATDITEAAVIIGLPSGLYSLNDDGGRTAAQVNVRIRQRPLSGGDWTEVTTIQIVAAKSVPFWRQHRWTLPSRGAYEIELTRMTDESKSSRVSDRVIWQALQSFRPEYPIAFEHPLVLTAMRVKATYQLNGQIDNFTGIFSRIAPDWDVPTQTWITRETRSPAAAMRWILQGPASAYPVSDVGVDLDLLADWSEWCANKGLCYDRIHEAEESLADALSYAAHAGRAQPRHDGRKWGVIVDRPSSLVVDHINPRNSRDFQWTRAYPKRPDGFRVKFQDSSNDWKASERIVPWPGLTGDVTVTEQLELPGKNDPDEIWIEARRRQYETDLRPDTFRVTQDGSARVATRGDLVAVSYDVLQRTQIAGRVKRVVGDLVELDESVEMEAGSSYAIRFRIFSADDTIGSSIVRSVATVPGASKAVRLTGTGSKPAADDLVHFGPSASESLLAFVRGEERGDDGAVIFHMVAAAPEIDTLTDAEVPPAWDGRAGTTYTGGASTPAPTAPVITSIQTGASGTGDANGLSVHLEPGTGSAAVVSRFQIQHRLAGASSWTTKTVPVAAGGSAISGYAWGNTVQIRVRALSIYDVAGPYTSTVSVTIGSADTIVPDATSFSVVRLSSGVRRYSVEIGSSSTTTVIGYKLRARPGSGWSWSQLTALHTGYLTGSPWESSEPLAEGTYTIGAVAVDATGSESRNPLLVTASLGPSYGAGVMTQRIESALGWPGTKAGATVVGGELVGGSSLPSVITYVLPTIDLGADMAVNVASVPYGFDGSCSISMKIGLDADEGPVGSSIGLGNVTARYFRITVQVSNSTDQARLGDLVTLITQT